MLHSFTKNYDDLSTEAGFQFEFHCDNCGNGFKSTFKESSTYKSRKRTEKFGSNVGFVGRLFGGVLGNLGSAIESGADMVRNRMEDRSPQWRREQEESFDAAQEEVKGQFTKCPSCNNWVCSDCWNEEEGLCIACAPRESTYVAKARNQAMRRNIDEQAEAATLASVNRPGGSEHQLGLAVDLLEYGDQEMEPWIGGSGLMLWLEEHCAEYGFIIRYPADKTAVTGVEYEPWHLRYVGSCASYIMENGLCLEEFLNELEE